MTLPPYNPDARCPKCGGHATTEYFNRRRALREASRFYADDDAPRDEHIRRTCTTCGYAWPEAPMDHIADVSKMVGEDG